MATMTTSTNSANLHSYYEKKLLVTAEPRLVLYPLGRKQRLPKGNGVQVKWLRYAAIAESTTPLTEGTPPSEVSASTSNVTSSVSQYGQFSKVSDLLSDTAIDPVLSNLSERFGVAMAKTIEKLIVNELDANAAVARVNNQANDAAMTSSDVLDHKNLIRQQIQQKRSFIGPHEVGDYVAVLHPFCEYDLKSDSQAGSWLDINKYTDKRPLMNGEFGRIYGMRLLVSDKMSSIAATADDPFEGGTSAAAVNLYNNYIIGEEAFGVVELQGDSMKMIIKRHGSAGANDPLDQFATVGYKIHGYATKYLEDASKRVIRLKAASALI